MKRCVLPLAVFVAVSAAALAQEAPTAPNAIYRGNPAQRRAFFGELHLHTTMSFDAWTFGTKVTPDQAYKFARGETIMVPAAQVSAEQGIAATADVPAKRAWPLDFTAVTDHAEYLGAMPQLDDPLSGFSQSPTGKHLRNNVAQTLGSAQAAVAGRRTEASEDLRAASDFANGWDAEIRAANDNYEPGTFTTFVAYEWTGTPGDGIHMHRNVIFNADRAPQPFSAVDSNMPEALWRYLDSVRAHGIDVLAIPHNSNLSDGRDFDWNMSDGRPIDEVYAQERALNEPLVEIAQTKGASDTTPQLSPTDEFANFEIVDRLYKSETAPVQHGSYVREAYGRGLVIASTVGVNPFKMGVVGGTDIHNGLTTSDENAFAGGISGIDPATMLPTGKAARKALGVDQGVQNYRAEEDRAMNPLQFSSGALTGVWAEENNRNAIFAALKRKETFATSGTRIRLRMFGGWGFTPKTIAGPDWVAAAYAEGVAMGSDLPAKPASARAPRFIVQAMKDPDSANLGRVQIIKIWLDGARYKEKVFDAALAGNRRPDRAGHVAPLGNTVDFATGTYRNTIGADTLTGVWQDPEFDPAKPAVYYARALEIPTPRWSTLLSIKNNLRISRRAPPAIQERAWTSPIWYTPEKS
jgi:Protein of unknown function (DUF3604)